MHIAEPGKGQSERVAAADQQAHVTEKPQGIALSGIHRRPSVRSQQNHQAGDDIYERSGGCDDAPLHDRERSFVAGEIDARNVLNCCVEEGGNESVTERFVNHRSDDVHDCRDGVHGQQVDATAARYWTDVARVSSFPVLVRTESPLSGVVQEIGGATGGSRNA